MHRILAIDGLRAVAVLAVLLFHLNESYLPGGYVGVDIFFVISGFVVTASLAHLNFERIRDLLTYFYARRLIRIMPALIVCLLVVSFVYTALVPPSWLSRSNQNTGIAAFLGLSNIVLALNKDEYFAAVGNFNPFLHTWSLGVEEQFYLIFPWIFFAYQRSKMQDRSTAWPLGVLAGLSLLSLALCAYFSFTNWQFSFYLLPARFWELGIGVLLFLTIDRWKPLLARRAGAIGIVGAILILASLGVPAGPMFPFPLAILPVVGSACIIAFVCARPDSGMARLLASKPMVAVGARSYSLYLWHWPVFVMFRWTIGLQPVLHQIVAVVLALVLGALSYAFVEQPVRTATVVRRTGRGRVVLIGLGAVLVATLAGKTILGAVSELSISRTANQDVWYPEASRPLLPVSDGCQLQQTSRPLVDGTVTSWIPTGCAKAAGRVFAIGDSHALAYTPMLRQFAVDHGVEVRLYFKTQCSFIGLESPMSTRDRCFDYRNKALAEFVTELGPRDVLFLPSLRIPQFSPNQWGDEVKTGDDTNARRAALTEALQVTKEISATGAHIVLEAPKPLFPAAAYRCADWYSRINPSCDKGLEVSRADLLARRAVVMDEMRDIAQADPLVSVWDPFPVLCPGTVCSAFKGEQPLFFDGHHLSGIGNDILRDAFGKTVSALLMPKETIVRAGS